VKVVTALAFVIALMAADIGACRVIDLRLYHQVTHAGS
jgi:hypothetical protein